MHAETKELNVNKIKSMELLSIALTTLALVTHRGPPCVIDAQLYSSSASHFSVSQGQFGTVTQITGTEWEGLGLLAPTSDCGTAPYPGATTVTVTFDIAPTQAVNVGEIDITCINGHSDRANLIVGPGCTSATFWFVFTCNDSGCTVAACHICSSGGEQQ